MRRLFWAGLGAAGTVLAARRVRRVAHRFTPEGVAEQVEVAGQQAASALGEAVAEFRTAYRSRQAELVAALLVDPDDGPDPGNRGESPPDDEPLYEF